MEWNALYEATQARLGDSLPTIFGALAILALGWIIAVVVRAALRRGLAYVGLNARVSASTSQQQPIDIEKPIALGAFWLVILVTVAAVFNTLHLDTVSAPFASLVGQIITYLPQLLAGTVLVLVAWLCATVLRALTRKLLDATTLDDRLAATAGMEPMSRNLANVIFGLVILLFLPAILAAYGLTGVLEPVQRMVESALQMVPDIFAAVAIGFVGWLVARVLRGLVRSLLQAVGSDRLGERIGLDESVRLSHVAGTLVFVLVFVPSLIAALDALHIEAISRPATDMLAQFFNAVPGIVAAALILTVTWFVARVAASLVARLLAVVGFDLLPQRMGLRAEVVSASLRPSEVAGKLVMFFAMLFAVVEAAGQLGFSQVRDIVAMFIEFGGDVLLGAVILVIGFWLANLAAGAIQRASGESSRTMATVARVAILGLVIAMGLRAMGIADDIVNLAFGLTLGAVAVAVALSFGLGGREAAGKLMEHWLSRWRRD
jgi:hypothetical protein